MARRHSLRASDSDRDGVAERLRAATAEGRLLAAELEQRLELALRARTYGELDELVVDLPAAPAPLQARRRLALPVLAGATLALGILSALAAAATTGFVRAQPAVAGGPPWMHGRPYGSYHAGPAGLVTAIASLAMIVFLVAMCAALGWLFSQNSDAAQSAPNP